VEKQIGSECFLKLMMLKQQMKRNRLPGIHPKNKPVTVKEVAEHAQVSVATVSRVLNGTKVDPVLYQRVISAVELLQYRPNRLARNLRTNTTKIIALVVPDIQNPFFVSVARGIEQVTYQEGYTLVICNTDDDAKREDYYFKVLSEEASAGLIVCCTDERLSHVQVRKSLEQGMAVVALDRRLEDVSIDSVLSDNFGGSRRAVSYLLELGHRRIGLIAGSDRFAPGRERRMGYEQAFQDYGVALDRMYVRVTDFRATEAALATAELLALPTPPTALFISGGPSVLGSLTAIHQSKLRIPDDISVVVFDDLDWAEAYNPPLTVVAQNTHKLGVKAAELLLERIRGSQHEPQEHRILTRLQIRESCRPIEESR
jgi:DNA-binding LacI/PurR family transcriptional regulator